MNTKKLIAVALAGFAVAAQAADGVLYFTGVGVPSCAAWHKPQYENYSKGFLDGYLTAGSAYYVNIAHAADPLKGMEQDQFWLWMDKYCKEHPLEDVHTGANALMKELFDRMQK